MWMKVGARPQLPLSNDRHQKVMMHPEVRDESERPKFDRE
jgi:hypothetical protein